MDQSVETPHDEEDFATVERYFDVENRLNIMPESASALRLLVAQSLRQSLSLQPPDSPREGLGTSTIICERTIDEALVKFGETFGPWLWPSNPAAATHLLQPKGKFPKWMKNARMTGQQRKKWRDAKASSTRNIDPTTLDEILNSDLGKPLKEYFKHVANDIDDIEQAPKKASRRDLLVAIVGEEGVFGFGTV